MRGIIKEKLSIDQKLKKGLGVQSNLGSYFNGFETEVDRFIQIVDNKLIVTNNDIILKYNSRLIEDFITTYSSYLPNPFIKMILSESTENYSSNFLRNLDFYDNLAYSPFITELYFGLINLDSLYPEKGFNTLLKIINRKLLPLDGEDNDLNQLNMCRFLFNLERLDDIERLQEEDASDFYWKIYGMLISKFVETLIDEEILLNLNIQMHRFLITTDEDFINNIEQIQSDIINMTKEEMKDYSTILYLIINGVHSNLDKINELANKLIESEKNKNKPKVKEKTNNSNL